MNSAVVKVGSRIRHTVPTYQKGVVLKIIDHGHGRGNEALVRLDRETPGSDVCCFLLKHVEVINE